MSDPQHPTDWLQRPVAPWPEPGSQPAAPPPKRSPVLGYALKGVGLVAIAVVSGLIYVALQPTPAPPLATPTVLPTSTQIGTYTFTRFGAIDPDSDCAKHSNDKVQQFLRANQCLSLRRAVFTTALTSAAGDRKVVTGVSVVKMGTDQLAAQLKAVTDANGTGNILDLVGEGTRPEGAPQKVNGGAYASQLKGDTVTIVESAYYGGKKKDNTLETLTNSAVELRLLTQS